MLLLYVCYLHANTFGTIIYINTYYKYIDKSYCYSNQDSSSSHKMSQDRFQHMLVDFYFWIHEGPVPILIGLLLERKLTKLCYFLPCTLLPCISLQSWKSVLTLLNVNK